MDILIQPSYHEGMSNVLLEAAACGRPVIASSIPRCRETFDSEVNPRFGGGYPHAYECGCDHMKFIVKILSGMVNECVIGKYQDDMYMMQYNEIMIR